MIPSLQNSMPHFDHWSKGDQSFAMAESTQTRLSQSQSTELVLYTREGDKVTLSSSAQYQARYATYEGLAGIGDMMTREKTESFEMSTGSQFSLTIEGDLNAQEKADIEKALKTIDKIMTDLISGESDKAIQKATKLSDLDTLQSLSADLQVQQEVHYEHRAAAMIADNPSPELSGPSADQEITGTPETAETAATTGITEAVQASGAVKGKLISLLNRYFSELQKKLTDDNADASGKAARVDRVKSGVREHIKEMRHAD
jgi:hypothetical protein